LALHIRGTCNGWIEIDVGQCLPVRIADDEALPFKLRVWIVDRPGRRDAAKIQLNSLATDADKTYAFQRDGV
jgi:hypothetical protein